MTIRDKRQKEFADVWLKHGKYGILNLCPRLLKYKKKNKTRLQG